MTETEQLAAVFERLGAARTQAQTMAAQLLRRAEQLAVERGTTREAELARLLSLATQGHGGVLPADFVPAPRPTPRQ
ncbi:MAG: hypothetical protein HZA93_28605 [Verrucomicrobia bacterium]|nr:hypothetical protein [Verrucomicrobiota bacterium]